METLERSFCSMAYMLLSWLCFFMFKRLEIFVQYYIIGQTKRDVLCLDKREVEVICSDLKKTLKVCENMIPYILKHVFIQKQRNSKLDHVFLVSQ